MHVVTTTDGRQCVEYFKLGCFDVVLMDDVMPHMSGIEATIQIRSLEVRWARERTPIIAVTANAFRHRLEEFLAAGADDVVIKPYQINELAAKVLRWSVSRTKASRLSGT